MFSSAKGHGLNINTLDKNLLSKFVKKIDYVPLCHIIFLILEALLFL